MTTPDWPSPDDRPLESGAAAEARMRTLTRRSILWSAGAIGLSWFTIHRSATSPIAESDGIPGQLRMVLKLNEKAARGIYREDRMSPQFAASTAVELKTNGGYGLDGEIDESSHKILVRGLHNMSQAVPQDGDEPAVEITVSQIKGLKPYTIVTEHKCIEGWSAVVQWKGARLRDLIVALGPATISGAEPEIYKRQNDLMPYVAMETPDGSYYVGLDMESALHAQTLLCYEMNGKPLTTEHGAPVRLAIPIKYGVKCIKRIGLIRFTRERPKDFWAERGYDWYAGL